MEVPMSSHNEKTCTWHIDEVVIKGDGDEHNGNDGDSRTSPFSYACHNRSFNQIDAYTQTLLV